MWRVKGCGQRQGRLPSHEGDDVECWHCWSTPTATILKLPSSARLGHICCTVHYSWSMWETRAGKQKKIAPGGVERMQPTKY